ncbi:hypothetical protein CC78DRAFT_532450 [Lojkania enalia]|uniref:Rhodopsin domain-containing protein n=1 Tax=Lojkania enalia TaxID=147567 RepID=A0A9P4K9U4_9PLEO|nr:hypothetical protein CC78DRAFT_532450 [Didymosphaeria enalia]
MAANPTEWPNRGAEILGSSLSICILSTAILVWRIVYGVKKRKLLVCDYLLIISACLNVVTAGIRIKTVVHGQGRHIGDPSISKPYDLLQYSYYLWINQILNLTAVAILKWSICAYLLALKFGTIYTSIVWLSIAMVVAFNFVIPMLGLFSCKPFEANWNKALKGRCFFKANMGLTYTQGVSNILTDVVYIVAPILYLSSVQLSRRTQWSLRIVFCIGIIATICSIFKTIELSALQKTKDPTWDGVNLTIWSATELSVGILVASLPPLRKQFDRLFRHILPSTFTAGTKTPGTRSRSGIQMYNISKRNTTTMGRSAIRTDGDSEQDILPDHPSSNIDGGITKTVVHNIISEERSDSDVETGPQNTYVSYGGIKE